MNILNQFFPTVTVIGRLSPTSTSYTYFISSLNISQKHILHYNNSTSHLFFWATINSRKLCYHQTNPALANDTCNNAMNIRASGKWCQHLNNYSMPLAVYLFYLFEMKSFSCEPPNSLPHLPPVGQHTIEQHSTTFQLKQQQNARTYWLERVRARLVLVAQMCGHRVIKFV